jgi:hypothetical protein
MEEAESNSSGEEDNWSNDDDDDEAEEEEEEEEEEASSAPATKRGAKRAKANKATALKKTAAEKKGLAKKAAEANSKPNPTAAEARTHCHFAPTALPLYARVTHRFGSAALSLSFCNDDATKPPGAEPTGAEAQGARGFHQPWLVLSFRRPSSYFIGVTPYRTW